MITDMYITTAYGTPSAKYKDGTQNQGDLLFDMLELFTIHHEK